MKVLIVHAHPEPRSFCSALRDAAVLELRSRGHEVDVSDLYAMRFDPVGGPGDFAERADPEVFDYLREQTAAVEKGSFVPALAAEKARLLACDALILLFPLWWYSLPAVLKGWVDRVFVAGGVTGAGRSYQSGLLRGKVAMLALTTEGAEESFRPGGRNGGLEALLFHVQRGMLHFSGMDVLSPFTVYGPRHMTPEQRAGELSRWRERLAGFERERPIDMSLLPNL